MGISFLVSVEDEVSAKKTGAYAASFEEVGGGLSLSIGVVKG